VPLELVKMKYELGPVKLKSGLVPAVCDSVFRKAGASL
jgi:hypothetical protein